MIDVKATAKSLELTGPEVKALDAFLNTTDTRRSFGNYHIIDNRLVYRACVEKRLIDVDEKELERLQELHRRGNIVLSKNFIKAVYENIIAVKLKQKDGSILTLGNSSVLDLIGGKQTAFNFEPNNGETAVQRLAARVIPLLPFSVFIEAGLKLSTIDIIERGPEESIERETPRALRKYRNDSNGVPVCVNPREKVHFTGASLFNVDGKYFLFDVDRREIQHYIFNPFLTQLPKKVLTIADAYESLKPDAVKRAEKKSTVLRQGEWFFIPVDEVTQRWLSKLEKQVLKGNAWGAPRIELRAGRNRPNHTQGFILHGGKDVTGERTPPEGSEIFVKGEVTHSGREHHALKLAKWYRPVANTATESFTITGAID
jgi:hypothetical protein